MPPVLDPSAPSRTRLSQACAECKRLKLKCDKNKPCSSCVRRGCASICPQGRTIAKGSRFILAGTEQLHEKIDTLINRIRQLELALEASHAFHSREPHALLGEALRQIATPVEGATSDPEPPGKEDELADCVGTLALDNNRGTRYFGSPGDFAFMWRDKDGPDSALYRSKGEVARALSELPTELAQMAQSFPTRLPTFDVTPLSTWILENCLPPYLEAWSLFENFWEHYATQFTPITRPEFVEQILSPLYQRAPDPCDKPLGHRLGLLFMVFSIGDLLDLTQPWVPSRGLRYYLIARASLCLDPVLESPTVTALQAMHLITIFLMMSPGTNEPEHAWVLTGINLKLALTLGLQHDANKFDLSAEDVENRRYALVSVVSVEIWQSLCLGRPPSQTFANFPWVFPKSQHGESERDPGKTPRHWIASFIRDVACKVLDTVTGNKVTSYSDILQLDAKIREYPSLPFDVPQGSEELSIGLTMQRTFMNVIKEMVLSFLHRRGFALALRDCPDNPLKSPYAPSVVACHRSAISYVSKICVVYSTNPTLALRIWYIWPNAFVATLVLGSIVARSPGCSLAPSSLPHLERVCQLWETASECVCGAKVLEIVRELRQKAFMAFAQSQAPREILNATLGGVQVLDEIHALGGYGPRVISTRPRSLSSTSSPYSSETNVHSESFHSPPSSNPSDPPSGNPPDPPYSNPSDPSVSNPSDLQSSNPSDDYTPSHTYNKPVYGQSTVPYTAHSVINSIPSAERAFNWEKYDYSTHLPAPSESTSHADFDVLGTTGNAPHVLQHGPTLLEELGLGGEWQPVMDHLGL